MKKPPAVEPSTKTVTVLSISPVGDDHDLLESILNRAEASEWKLHSSFGLESALSVARQNMFSIIVSERDLSPGTWEQVLAAINELPNPPLLIVTSRLADERLWSEVINLGGWDVLAKPFNVEEVWRVLSMAWLHWQNRTQYPGRRKTVLTMLAG